MRNEKSFHLPGGTWGPTTDTAQCVLTDRATDCHKAEGDFCDYFYDFYKVFVAVDKAEQEKGLTCSAVAVGEQRCLFSLQTHFVGLTEQTGSFVQNAVRVEGGCPVTCVLICNICQVSWANPGVDYPFCFLHRAELGLWA